ncbi:MAG: FecR family protein [Pseudolabrys sp.]
MERGHRVFTRLLTLLLSTVTPLANVAAQNYGKVGAVNPDATGTPSGGATRTLTVGANVVRNERIQTSASGSAQIQFPDQSTLNVGSNSNIVIDEFVYNPNERTGTMVASAVKGAFRYVGGQISHTAGATINTPLASLGVRGGIVTLLLPVPANVVASDPRLAGQGQLVISHHGTVTIHNGVSTITLRPGFAVIINSANQPIQQPFRLSDATLQLIVQTLRSRPGQSGGIGSARIPTNRTFAGPQPPLGTPPPGANQAGGPGGGPGSDPLGYTSIFSGGNSAATGKAQSTQTPQMPPRPPAYP